MKIQLTEEETRKLREYEENLIKIGVQSTFVDAVESEDVTIAYGASSASD